MLISNQSDKRDFSKFEIKFLCRNAPKTSGSSAQLTIFYAGSVNVYDDVSPEKVFFTWTLSLCFILMYLCMNL